jgi:hypothetical protein
MWNIFGTQNLLKGKWHKPTIKQVSEIYKNIIDTIRKEFSTLDKGQFVNIKYEDLDKNPIDSMKYIYQQLGLTFTPSYEENLTKYCIELKKYKKNKFNISDVESKQIKDILAGTLTEYYKN